MKLSRLYLLLIFIAGLISCQRSVVDPTASAASATKIYVFHTWTTAFTVSNLNLGGRSGSTTICTNLMNANYASLGCSGALAFLSISAGDSIANMSTNYGFPSTIPVYRPDGTLIASTWSQFANGTGTLTNGIITSGLSFPMGATTTGGVNASNCSGFTSTAGFGAAGGMNSTTTGQWLNNGSSWNCANPNDIVCICY